MREKNGYDDDKDTHKTSRCSFIIISLITSYD